METNESSINEPELKRPKMEEDSVAPVPQPVIVAMNQEASEWISEWTSEPLTDH